MNDHAPLWYTARKKVKSFSNKMEKFQFQVGCMYFTTLKQNKAFKEKIERTCDSTCDALA